MNQNFKTLIANLERIKATLNMDDAERLESVIRLVKEQRDTINTFIREYREKANVKAVK